MPGKRISNSQSLFCFFSISLFSSKEHKILKRKKRRSDKPIARDWPRAIHNCREAKFDPHFFFADRDSNVESDRLFKNSERRSGIESLNV